MAIHEAALKILARTDFRIGQLNVLISVRARSECDLLKKQKMLMQDH